MSNAGGGFKKLTARKSDDCKSRDFVVGRFVVVVVDKSDNCIYWIVPTIVQHKKCLVSLSVFEKGACLYV